MKSAKFYLKCTAFLTNYLKLTMETVKRIIEDADQNFKFNIKDLDYIPIATLNISDQQFAELKDFDLKFVGFSPYQCELHNFKASTTQLTMSIRLDPLFLTDFKKSFPENLVETRLYSTVRLYESLNLKPEMLTAIEANFKTFSATFPLYHEHIHLAFADVYSMTEHFQLTIYLNKMQFDLLENIRAKDNTLHEQRMRYTVPQSRKIMIPATNQTLDTEQQQIVNRDREIELLRAQVEELKLSYASINDEFKTPRK